MEKVLAGGLDIGTSGCKIALYDENCAFVRDAYCPYDVSRSGGLHEIDVTAVFDAVKKVIKEADCSAVSAIAVTSFGETFTMLDENDNVCAPSMLYTDPRGKEAVMHLTERFGKEEMAFKTGTKMHEMYSLPKLMWIKENMPEAFSRAKKILLMQDYIVYMLSGVRQIDFSLAARTACFDIENKCWDEELILDIPAERTDPRNAHAKEGIADCLRMEKPQKYYEEMCYYHTLKYGRVSAYNPKIKKRVTMSFKRSELPFFTEWKMMGERDYVLGLEPGNCLPDGRDVMREKGLLEFIDPGNEKTHHIEFYFTEE